MDNFLKLPVFQMNVQSVTRSENGITLKHNLTELPVNLILVRTFLLSGECLQNVKDLVKLDCIFLKDHHSLT